MLAEVERAVSDERPIVFLAWAPHPMNTRFNIRYLTGGDASFGPNFGAATVNTLTRAGYAAECPNVGRLLANFELSVDLENEWMDAVLNRKVDTVELARRWVESRPELMMRWLVGVRSIDGEPALAKFESQGARSDRIGLRGLGHVAQDSGRRCDHAGGRVHRSGTRRDSSTACRRSSGSARTRSATC